MGQSKRPPSPTLPRRLQVVIRAVCAGALLCALFPSIDLGGGLGDAVVRLSDTGSSAGLPILSITLLVIVVMRPGLTRPRQSLETFVVIAAMLLSMAVGSVDQRRDLLSLRLTPESTPDLSEAVRSHWIETAGYSMPSGHATAAMTFAILWAGLGLAWLDGWRRFLTVVLIPIWSVAMAWTRVLLRAHTTADVTVGTIDPGSSGPPQPRSLVRP